MRRETRVVLFAVVLSLLAAPVQSGAQEATPTPLSSAASGDFAERVSIGGGRSLYLECHGEGGPVVLLEAGSGSTTRDWGFFSAEPAKFTRVCAYDRANVPGGRSDPTPPGTITAADIVADLHGLLTAAQVPGPYVLAAHSAGGDFIWLYAATYPEEVAGMVFIDAPVGWNELFVSLVPEPDMELVRLVQSNKDPQSAERIDYFISDEQAMAVTPPAVPSIVIAHGAQEGLFPDGQVHGMFPPTWPVDDLEEAWRTTIVSNAAVLAARFIVAEQSHHFIYIDQPDLVTEAIHEVVDAVRDPDTWATPQSSPVPA
jgi:pimeloyl-ACP methyl ester carboxylesterase